MKKVCGSLLNCPEEKIDRFVKNGYMVQECRTCGHRYVRIAGGESHVTKVYGDDYFFGGKAGYPDYLEEKETLIRSGVRYARILKRYMKPGRDLDVGCSAGFIMQGFEKEGWHFRGLEPNNNMAAHGREKLGLNIQTATLETFESVEMFDLIVLVQVIGHFYDMDKAMMNVSKFLKPGGFVLVESWDMNSLMARLSGKRWHEYSPPSVVHWYSGNTLADLFEYYGFKIVSSGRPSKKISFRHALSLAEEKLPDFIFKKKVLGVMSNGFGGITFLILRLT